MAPLDGGGVRHLVDTGPAEVSLCAGMTLHTRRFSRLLCYANLLHSRYLFIRDRRPARISHAVDLDH